VLSFPSARAGSKACCSWSRVSLLPPLGVTPDDYIFPPLTLLSHTLFSPSFGTPVVSLFPYLTSFFLGLRLWFRPVLSPSRLKPEKLFFFSNVLLLRANRCALHWQLPLLISPPFGPTHPAASVTFFRHLLFNPSFGRFLPFICMALAANFSKDPARGSL